MTRLALKVTVLLCVLAVWFGLLLPYMISSAYTFLVVGGFLITTFAVVFTVLSVCKSWIELQIVKEKQRKEH